MGRFAYIEGCNIYDKGKMRKTVVIVMMERI